MARVLESSIGLCPKTHEGMNPFRYPSVRRLKDQSKSISYETAKNNRDVGMFNSHAKQEFVMPVETPDGLFFRRFCLSS